MTAQLASSARTLLNPEAPAPGSEERTRVLVADDDRRVRSLISRVLRLQGFEVLEACDGLDALLSAERYPPNLAIIDLRMPRLDGYAVVRKLKEEHESSLPVLVLSGVDSPEDRLQAFEDGADDFIGKPVYVQELLKRVGAHERTHRAFLQARQAQERADHLRMFANEAAALLAHDLANGLGVASANLQFIGEELPAYTDDPELTDALGGAERALRRMAGLVSNFVDISRLEDAALVPSRRPTDICELLSSAADIHEPRQGRSCTIEISAPPELRADIDPMLVERILHNLLNNATRYVAPGGRIQLAASVREGAGERVLRLGVGNTGEPIPEALRPQLFAKYRKGTDGRARHGMGLYFCRLASEAHGGSIEVKETEEFPTHFEILLPF